MRNRFELQRAHDLAIELVTGRIPIDLSDDDRAELALCADVLSWALGQDADSTFGDELARLERRSREYGEVSRPLPGLRT